MTTPQTLPGYTPPFTSDGYRVVDANSRVLVAHVTGEQAESLALILNAHSPLVEALQDTTDALMVLHSSPKDGGMPEHVPLPIGGALKIGVIFEEAKEALSLAGVKG